MENDSWFPPCAIARSTAANNQLDVVRRRRVSVAGMLSVRRLFQRLLPKLRGHNAVESGNEIAFHPTVFTVPGVEIVPDECHRILRNSPPESRNVRQRLSRTPRTPQDQPIPCLPKGTDSPRTEMTADAPCHSPQTPHRERKTWIRTSGNCVPA